MTPTTWILAMSFLALLAASAHMRHAVVSQREARERAREEADTRERYLQVIRSVVVSADLRGRVTLINAAGRELLGLSDDAPVGGLDWFETFVPEATREERRREFERFVSDTGTETQDLEYEVAAADGSRRTMRWYRTKVHGPSGELIGVLSSGQDVTDRLETEREAEFKAFLLDSATDAILVIGSDGLLRYANEAVYRIRGLDGATSASARPFLGVAPSDRDLVRRSLAQAWEAGVGSFEIGLVHRDGRRIPVEVHAQTVERAGERVLLAVCRDVSERYHAEERIRVLLERDPLTGLANASSFEQRLGLLLHKQAARNGTIAVYCVSLEGFQMLADTFGRDFGDLALRKVALRLSHMLKDGDLLGRVGDEEFMLARPVDDERAVGEYAERLRTAFDPPLQTPRGPLQAKVTVGVTHNGDGDEDARRLMHEATFAMHHASASGSGGYLMFRPGLHVESLARFALRNDLRTALDRDEFEIHYQPLASLSDGALVGVEALLRWRHPGQGLVRPDDFIPLAEADGLIVPIGAWVLRRACEQAVRLQAEGHGELRVSVNVSPLQLQDPGLVDTVRSALTGTGLAPGRLELELTETAVMEDATGVAQLLEELRSLGVGLAIDDFGTGYSSLERLSELPITSIKIDRSFVQRLEPDSTSESIVSTILGLAHSLRLEVVAEGVETREQAEALRRMGCHEMQGYLLSRPLPPETLEAFLRQRDDRDPSFAGVVAQ